jgi:asparagine synthase (glutamine-hydrolysing)
MSAIAGVWFFDGRPDALHACERMQQALLPYGPDRLGVWSGGDIALASCLMRLLPEDRFDAQPMHVRGGRLIVVADARLYNRDELLHALDINPSDGKQLSDSDILAKALERWGEAALSRLVGDFAFAAWDVDTRSLLIARDHLDARPLHYHIGNGWFAFASMPKGLLALDGVSAEPNIERLCAWQLLWTKEPGSTFYEAIQCVEPGHFIRINSRGVVTLHRHWQPECLPRLRFQRFDDYGDALRELLDRSTAARLRSTGGISMLLSGGLDSTAVAASAAMQLGHDRGPLHAFTSVPMAGTPPGYAEHVFIDEGPLAALMAKRYTNIKHHLVSSEGCDLLAEMQASIAWADQPVLNPTNTVWMNKAYGLSQQAGCTVVLTGGKGNLALSYDGTHVLAELFGQLRWFRLFSEALGLVRSGRAKRMRGLLRQAVEPWLHSSLGRLLGNAKQFESSINSMFLLITPHIEEWLGSREATIHLQPAHIKHRCYRDWLVSFLRVVDSGNVNAAINAL